MGLFSFLSGKSPEEIELVGDHFFKAKEFGAAKIEYERAVEKIEKKFPEKVNLIQRLKEKIIDSKESLAKAHKNNSEQLIETGNLSEAEDLLHLALELTEDNNLTEEIKRIFKKLHKDLTPIDADDTKMFLSESEPFPTEEEVDSDDDYFLILCNALPEDVRKAYQAYDQSFKQGFIALNNGDFEAAVEKFMYSMSQSGLDQPLIPLELSTAWAHMEQYDRARDLLEAFIVDNPQEVRAYQMLSDIYWVTAHYDDAIALIEQCPSPLSETFPIRILLGETYYQMGKYADAEALFLACETHFGQNEMITRSLAKTYEAMGDLEKARDIYARLLKGCTQCGVRRDPFIQSRYAELCFACGERSSRLIDLYLSIVRDDPDNKDEYHRRIYELYMALGDTAEAERYRSFA